MFYYVYVLQSIKDKSLYIGFTEDLKRRLNEHNSGKNISTKKSLPHKIIFYEAFLDKSDALNREKYLKSGWGHRSIKTLLNDYLNTDLIR
ncbi:GIY-YIG nuclease family protein [candidate division WWE3 bacterium]|uniref:GIY-YIG nuclease family protein n=1 Tax=candidate division WWE3 bacterium TaxID=2053526 RepID=A0A955LLD2_UNCKA|nr:GIY-YIG nuclease family protein [candidate division WWE3 bacterium]